MERFVDGLLALTQKIITYSVLGGTLIFMARELQSAALKKAAQGTTNLSRLTQKMTMNASPINSK